MAFTPSEIEEGLEQNSSEAIEYLYRTFRQACIREIREGGGQKEDGEDIFQVSIVSLIEAIRSGRYQSGNLYGYFKTIMRNTWKRHLRRKAKFVSTSLDEADEPLMEQKIYTFRTAELVQKYLTQLGGSCKELFQAVYWSGMKQKDVAEEMGMEYDSVRSRLSQCRKQLFDILRKDPDFQQLAQSS